MAMAQCGRQNYTACMAKLGPGSVKEIIWDAGTPEQARSHSSSPQFSSDVLDFSHLISEMEHATSPQSHCLRPSTIPAVAIQYVRPTPPSTSVHRSGGGFNFVHGNTAIASRCLKRDWWRA
jgi:hypothetical protein